MGVHLFLNAELKLMVEVWVGNAHNGKLKVTVKTRICQQATYNWLNNTFVSGSWLFGTVCSVLNEQLITAFMNHFYSYPSLYLEFNES